MSSDIPSSNLYPYGKEEAFLRELLDKHNRELSVIEETVESKRLELHLCGEGVHRLESALKTTRQALDCYQMHRDHLNSTQQAFNTHFSDSLPLFDNIPSYKNIRSFLAENISSRNAACEAELEAVRIACDNLRQTVHILDEELRCQRISFTFSELSLRTSLVTRNSVKNTVDIIKEKFRAIKRIPVEIWLDILGMVVHAANAEWKVTNKDYDLLYPAMRLAQVCESWRQIILDTPTLWTTISCGSTGEQNHERRDNLIALFFMRARGLHLTIVDREHVDYRAPGWGSWWPLQSESAATLSPGYNYHLRISDQYPNENFDHQTWPTPLQAIFQAQPFTRPGFMTAEMLKHLKDVPNLTLINIPLREAHSVVSDSLTSLKLEFNSPVIQFTFFDPLYVKCRLNCLLHRSLQTLELSQYARGTITFQGPVFHLPNLRLLSVTPHEHQLLRFLDAPSITSLKISYPPGPLTFPFETWVTPFLTICASIRNLQVSWVKDGEPNALSLLTALWKHAPKLQAITISNATLNGEELCGALENGIERGNRLTSLSIHGCIGISRTHCERVASMVDKMSVFDSEFRLQPQEPTFMFPFQLSIQSRNTEIDEDDEAHPPSRNVHCEAPGLY